MAGQAAGAVASLKHAVKRVFGGKGQHEPDVASRPDSERYVRLPDMVSHAVLPYMLSCCSLAWQMHASRQSCCLPAPQEAGPRGQAVSSCWTDMPKDLPLLVINPESFWYKVNAGVWIQS